MTESSRGHLVVALPFDAELFNEVYRNYTGAGGYFAANNIFSRLVVLDVFDTGDIYPDLAEKWDILDNGARYIFYLNRTAHWHDGVPVTAHDVVYTYQQVLEHGYHGLSWLQDIKEISAIDDHTVDCRLQAPNAAFLAQLGAFVFSHILPKHLYEGTNWEDNPHNLQPIGSGPFRFEQWIPGDCIELVANDDYFGDGPYVDRITYRIMPDRDETFAALESGDVHFAVRDVPCQQIDEWKAKPGVDMMFHPGNAIAFLAFNHQRKPWTDRRVREAIGRMIDRSTIAPRMCPLATAPVHYYHERITWAFNPDARAPQHDPIAAAQLLDQAGLKPDEHGIRLRCRLSNRTVFAHYDVAAEEIAAQLASVGIEVTTESLGPVEWKERVQDAADFDLIIESGDIGPDPQLMASFLTSDGPRNTSRYFNPDIDAAFRDGRASVDLEERGKHYKRMQAILAEDVARIPLIQHGEHLPFRPEFTGWSWSDGVRGTVPFWYHGKVRVESNG
jgi:peptide/nickel transport system substrate-binding protein